MSSFMNNPKRRAAAATAATTTNYRINRPDRTATLHIAYLNSLPYTLKPPPPTPNLAHSRGNSRNNYQLPN